MSLNKRTSLVSILVRRIAIICFISNFILILALYFWLRYELAIKDQELAKIRFHEVAEVLEHEGVDFLNSQVERGEFDNLDTMLIQVYDGDKIVIDKKPNRMHYFSQQQVEATLAKAVRSFGNSTIYPKRFGQETIELYTGKMNGWTVIVGVNTDASEDFVNLFGHNALILLIFTVLFISWMSYFFVQKSLFPINSLISTIKNVRAGRFAPAHLTITNNDEVSELSILFNSMLEEIEHLVKSLQSSLDSIAHDLRTPLMHLRLKIDDLSKRLGHEKLTFEVLGDFLEETQKIEDLLSQLLEISNSTSSHLFLNKTEISLKQTIEEILDIYEYVIEEQNVHIQNISEDVVIFADKGKLKRVIANLLDNSIKYSKKGGSVVKFQIEKRSSGEIIFSVSDNGIGIPENEFHRIWERLYRIDPSRATVGVGLGLSLVKSLVEAHGWSISVESKLSVGSKFIISMPDAVVVNH